jgi:hypothetical protein
MKEYLRKIEAITKRSIEELGKGVLPTPNGSEELPGEADWEPEANAKGGPKSQEGGVIQGELYSSQVSTDLGVSQLELTGQEVQVLERVLWFPDETIGERGQSLRIDRAKEWRARQRLILQGLLVVAGKIGKWEFFGPTEVGKKWAAERGMQERRFKSGLLHEILLRRVEIAISGQMPNMVFRKGGQLEGVQYDLLASGKEDKVPVQVSVTNTARYEAERVRRLGSHACVSRVVIVGATKKKVGALEKELRRIGGDEVWEKVVLVSGEDVMKNKVNWKEVVKGAVKASHEGHVCSDDQKGREGERKA